jgi:DNA helicase II / ATP-dependent DNA helicase PcrA
MSTANIKHNDADAWVDEAVLNNLNPDNFKSFFLFAGAGSGKTRTLVNVLTKFKDLYGDQFRLRRQKVAVITYTNAAADEIIHRLEYHPFFQISTIHSFAWQLIRPYTVDIRERLRVNLNADIDSLMEEQSRSKNLQNKTSIDRAKQIESKNKRLQALDNIVKFMYNPNGDNISKDSLNHTEVISMAADFINTKPLMQQLFASHYPVLLIDESQDTKKELIDAFFTLQQAMPKSLCVGLFGDTMQRIYSDGKENLHKAFPKEWETPRKKLNHRSSKRIIALINSIRDGVDEQKQEPRLEQLEGIVRLFICARGSDKSAIEAIATKKMAVITQDSLWNLESNNVKTLILEHHMAAKRMGFFVFFEPLYKVSRFSTGILDGSLSGITLFTKIILPLLVAHRSNNKYEIARIIKKESPLLGDRELRQSKDQLAILKKSKGVTDNFFKLWDKDEEPTILEVLQNIYESNLFVIPDGLYPIVSRTEKEKEDIAKNADPDEDEVTDEELAAWETALAQPFSQIEKYNEYLSESSKFGTHQGVKGLEYPRVMVIIDDEEARGFMFSYDKLFGTKELSTTDHKNIGEGKETGVDRTKRLFYVACSRARESLAIMAYTDNPEIVRQNALALKWFGTNEIELL